MCGIRQSYIMSIIIIIIFSFRGREEGLFPIHSKAKRKKRKKKGRGRPHPRHVPWAGSRGIMLWKGWRCSNSAARARILASLLSFLLLFL